MTDRPDDIRAYFDPKRYVEAWELDGKEVNVTIARVVGEEVELPSDGPKPKKEKRPVLHFSDWPKPLALGREMVAQLITMYGVFRPKDFVGRRLTIYPTREKYFGEMWDVVRIRKAIPPAAAPSAQQRAERPALSTPERIAAVKKALSETNTQAGVATVRKNAQGLIADLAKEPAELLDDLNLSFEARQAELEEAK